MVRSLALWIGLVLTLVLAQGSHAQEDPQLDNLCDDILQTLQAYYPVHATEMGIHNFDHRFTDYSPTSVKAMIGKLDGFRRKLAPYANRTLTTEQGIRYDLIRSNVEIALLDLKEIAWHNRLPQLYIDEAITGLYLLLNSQHASMDERIVPIMARMMAVPGLFLTAKSNIKHPPQIWIDEALESIEPAIEFYRQVSAELMQRYPNRADAILESSTSAREAMSGFAQWLQQVQPGDSTSFAIGTKNFNFKLQHEHFLPYDADSLLRLGEALLAEAQAEYADYRQYVEEDRQTGADDPYVPRCFSRTDILDYYNWEVAKVREFCEHNDIVTVPAGIAPVVVVETPPYLQSMVTGIAYQPAGPFDEVQRAQFFVRPIPENLDSAQLAARAKYVHRRGFKGSVVHEGYPGHHLQMQVAGMHGDPVRKWHQNSLTIEGWALYCEEMMYEAGLYGGEDHGMWLAILGGIRFRAARIVADVKLHTGQFTYQQCVDWMVEALEAKTDSDREYIRNQVRLYTHRPTTQMSYLIGKLEILKLREALIAIEGENFSLRQFHDALLGEGSVPPALIWKAWELETGE